MEILTAIAVAAWTACACKGLMVWSGQAADFVDRKLRERQHWKEYRALVPKAERATTANSTTVLIVFPCCGLLAWAAWRDWSQCGVVCAFFHGLVGW